MLMEERAISADLGESAKKALRRGERIDFEPFFCSGLQGGIDSLLWSN
jgi:hypothetical protein